MTRMRAVSRLLILAPFSLVAVLGVLVLMALLAPARATASPAACTGPNPGQHIYDCANILTEQQVAQLEEKVNAVQQAGAPVVVYIRVQDSTDDETVSDAAHLMDLWDVESAPNARDGVVIFFNLDPSDTKHGHYALYAGQQHHQKDGTLPQGELERIRDDVMLPHLRDADIAGAIAAALDAVAHDLRYGPPPPSPFVQAMSFLATWPLSALAALFVLVVGGLLIRARALTPQPVAVVTPRMTPPDDLKPGMAGALLEGRVTNAQMEATVLDFARRGLLVLEPAGAKKVEIRLTNAPSGLEGYERTLWNSLEAQADPFDHVIAPDDLPGVRSAWGMASHQLRDSLNARGWFDTHAAHALRLPLLIAGGIGAGGAVLAFIVAILGKQGWGTVAVVLFAVAAALAFIAAYRIPNTSAEGQRVAAPWREYRAGLRSSTAAEMGHSELDVAIPFAVAMGTGTALNALLKRASKQGYAPAWFIANLHPSTEGERRTRYAYTGFYPYWTAFHSGMYPSSSGSGGGFSGGASAGGGGAGGSF